MRFTYRKLSGKTKKLSEILTVMDEIIIAYSGGVDSTFLLAFAQQHMGDRVSAVTVVSDLLSAREVEEARNFSASRGIRHAFIETDILTLPVITANPPDRCYHCKKEIYKKIICHAKKLNIRYIVEGSNLDDLMDYRPGKKALEELGISSPLLDAGLTKKDVRELSKKMSLPTWNKPAGPCLATRIPYGTEITREILEMIRSAEDLLRMMGLKEVRVRYHDGLARIEVPRKSLYPLFKKMEKGNIAKKFRDLGFAYVTIDMEGYRTGSMNETLKEK